MVTPRRHNVLRYQQDGRALYNDLLALIEDLRDTREHKIRVRYCVDFSEIFSYSSRDGTFTAMRLFGDDSDDTLKAVEAAALGTLFDDRREDLVLLPPYAIELQSYARSLQSRSVAEAAASFASATAELANLRRKLPPRFSSPLTDAIELTPDELAFLEQHSGTLVALLGTRHDSPHRRLTRLLGSNTFSDSDVLVPADLAPDERVVDRWYSYLAAARKGRPDGSSYLDAVAAGLVFTSEARLRDQGYRLRIVTRSRHMVDLAEAEVRDHLWSSRPVMQSRIFSMLPPRAESADALERLETLAESLALFLRSYDDMRPPATAIGDALPRAAGSSRPDDIEGAIEDIKSQLRARSQLVSSLHGAAAIQEVSAERREPLVDLIRTLMNDDSALHKIISRRLEELLEDVERQNQFLSLALREDERPGGHEALEHFHYRVHGTKAVLSSNLQWMPYTLQFSSADLSHVTGRLVPGSAISADEMLRLFRHQFDAGVDYERLLSMAYLAACWNLWPLALTYCDLALRYHAQQKSIPEHEGLFFKAVCLRMTARSGDDYGAALDYISAAKHRKASIREPKYEDPRYLKEEAVVILAWHKHFPHETMPRPSFETAVRLSERALTHVENDHWLKAQLLNNLCFMFVDLGPDHVERARQYYDALLRVLEDLGKDVSELPANFIDTIAWAQFKLGLTANLPELARMLDDQLNRPIDDRARAAIHMHARTIRDAIASA